MEVVVFTIMWCLKCIRIRQITEVALHPEPMDTFTVFSLSIYVCFAGSRTETAHNLSKHTFRANKNETRPYKRLYRKNETRETKQKTVIHMHLATKWNSNKRKNCHANAFSDKMELWKTKKYNVNACSGKMELGQLKTAIQPHWSKNENRKNENNYQKHAFNETWNSETLTNCYNNSFSENMELEKRKNSHGNVFRTKTKLDKTNKLLCKRL